MTPSSKPGGSTAPCPACGKATSGRYCADCGALVGEDTCRSCRSVLTPGARFCHSCGAPAGAARESAPPPRGKPAPPKEARAPRGNLALILGGIAFMLMAIIYAAQRAGQEPAPAAMGAPAGPAGIDVASMSPQERVNRLFDRIMLLHEQGKKDSVQFFSTMAIGVYESMGPLDTDMRYDFGRVAEVSGNLDIAQAQSDTILAQDPEHLLGLILGEAVARAGGNASRSAELQRRLVAAEARQLARNLQEYALHKADIDAALAAARAR